MRKRVLMACTVVLAACGGGAASSAPVAPVVPARAPAAPPRDHALKRSAVHEVVSRGLGVFLQRIEFDDRPVRMDGKFRGFRIAALRDEGFWRGVDLKPGDVITGVNGFPIERPEQAQTAFDSLEVASELHVDYDRDGLPRSLSYAIVDDR